MKYILLKRIRVHKYDGRFFRVVDSSGNFGEFCEGEFNEVVTLIDNTKKGQKNIITNIKFVNLRKATKGMKKIGFYISINEDNDLVFWKVNPYKSENIYGLSYKQHLHFDIFLYGRFFYKIFENFGILSKIESDDMIYAFDGITVTLGEK